ncbi:hypothetical protein EC844_11375 [Acinetobacter calcoaceticus]|uniref:Uncharacterized protein n=1 Tax=Acinetobacter calcoaceticus TaxID=471 RepID=A0A4R1XW31_ACICA|nr:hypothetical protein EC844_11375 [Acinetobacter calcoaceticus]
MNSLGRLNSIALSSFILAMPALTFADLQSLKKMETEVISNFKDRDFFEVNGDIESQISSALAADPASFNYNFPKLQQAGYVYISYSPDKKLKFYNFNTSGGGTMGEAENYVQYQIGNQTKFDQFDAGYHIYNIQQANIKNKPVYLVASYYKGDNCHGLHVLRAVEVGSKQLLKAYVFQGKNKTNHDISVEYDCHKNDNPQHEPDYLRISPTAVDIILIDQNGIPQNKYLRYRLEKSAFVYTGVVK